MKDDMMIKQEIPRILDFITNYVGESARVAIAVSGGLDSDVVARLCAMALGVDRIKLWIVRQPQMEQKYLDNARVLAKDLGVQLVEIDLGEMSVDLIRVLESADPDAGFRADSLLDPARANSSIRTALLSSYQEKGYIIAGTTNKTESLLGFFLPFGDYLGHFKPIAHLFKSEVRLLAQHIGVRAEVIDQPASAGFWEGENDLEDVAYWLYNCGPIPGGRTFTDEDDLYVKEIQSHLSQLRIDICLEELQMGRTDKEISHASELPLYIVQALRTVVKTAAKTKNLPLLQVME